MLYIVSTPIGNLDDITYRAVKTLELVDFIICEDSRVTGKLLSKYNISKKLYVYNDHSTESERLKIIDHLQQGKKAALVSDAGTPLISDPGYKLILQLKQLDIKITAAPGVSSIITAMSLAGLPTDRFYFAGYLPSKSSARIKILHELIDQEATLVFLESARRLSASLEDILLVFGDRNASVARELTKMYEEVSTDLVSNLIVKYQSGTKGEIVLLVSGKTENTIFDEKQLITEAKILMQNYSSKETALIMHYKYKKSKSYFYDLVKNMSNNLD
jgi:16S rRNA (cytidine1402-2'-O)-methyltransferase